MKNTATLLTKTSAQTLDITDIFIPKKCPAKVNTNRKTMAILGAGKWGSALATLAAVNDHELRIWSRSNNLTLEEAIAGADIILSAISMKGVPKVIAKLKQLNIPEETIFVTATKGLDPETLQTPSQMWQAAFPKQAIAVLSGPNLSVEIEAGKPAATVIASTDMQAAETLQDVFSSDCFRVYTNDDPLGAELGGTLKNIMAIAVGLCDGLDLGTNAKSALMTRALPEMMRVGTHFGAKPETFLGLAGLGDMLATCSSSLSRNYRVGYGLAQGKNLEQILEELGSTAEGVNTVNVLLDLANREGISVTIARHVYRVLNGTMSASEVVSSLMERDLKPESCDLLTHK